MAVTKETSGNIGHEILGILLIFACALGILSLMSYSPMDIASLHHPPSDPPANFIGPVGAWFAFICFMLFGVAGYLIPAALAYVGLICLLKREGRIWPKSIWATVLVLSVAGLCQLNPDIWTALCAKLDLSGLAGGVLGDLWARRFLVQLMGSVGAGIVTLLLLLISSILLFNVRPLAVAQWLQRQGLAAWQRHEASRLARMDRTQQIEEESKDLDKKRRDLEKSMGGERPPDPKEPAVRKRAEKEPKTVEPEEPKFIPPASVRVRQQAEATQDKQAMEKAVKPDLPDKAAESDPPKRTDMLFQADAGESPDEKAPPVIKAARVTALKKNESKASLPAIPSSTPSFWGADAQASFNLPGYDVLDPLPPQELREHEDDFTEGSQILKDTLAEFNVDVEVTNVERGPVVTRYELLPAAGVKVERISGLNNNIALAMKAESIRIQAPIPGKGVVGIEVPNPKTTTVYLREILESDIWKSGKHALPLAFGKDVGGHVMVADLADMPHMLIAGATGSGKTVCMNSILAGLLMSRTPDQMKLMLVDPKIVEFAMFNKLPHLVVPVITDPKKVMLGLRWAINEMERRYKTFAKAGVRNIKAFNSRPIVKQAELFEPDLGAEVEEAEEKTPDRLPYIVIVIDELADLMLVAQSDIETSIARLAQLSRAVGIHLIIATQRPSVNVITGTIKANLPARVSFQVAQKVDSRTILDASGAEKLLGRGDMLFLPPGSPRLIRAQGTLTTDTELRKIVEFLQAQGEPQYEMAIKEKLESKSADLPDLEEDDLLEASLEVIRQTRRASTSSLQRRLRIGYTRAARIMDLLEQKGIVGPAQGSDPREILIDLDGEVPSNANETEQ